MMSKEEIRVKWDKDYTSLTCCVCRDLWEHIEKVEARNKKLEVFMDKYERIFINASIGDLQELHEETKALQESREV